VRTFNSACQQNKNYLGDSLTKSQLRNLASMIRAQADILFFSSNGGPLIYANATRSRTSIVVLVRPHSTWVGMNGHCRRGMALVQIIAALRSRAPYWRLMH
jgi:hypothetical protein